MIPALLLLLCALLRAEPNPGDVFREYTYGNRFSELDPGSKRELDNMRRRSGLDRMLDVYDLEGATRAEVVVEYWGGHLGTTDQAFRANGHEWIGIPQPSGTPTPPQCYYRTLLKATTAIPLAQLKAGANRFQFKAGPQSCHGFDWGFYWIYAFTVRVYYDGKRPHPTGSILSHSDGGRIEDFPRFVVEARGEETPIQRVDVIANYDDFNWEGDGVSRQWHYIMERGQLKRHVGSVFSPPFAVTWDTQWVPDQDAPVEVAARITDNTGLTFLTPSRKLTLARASRSVGIYRAADFGEKFGVRLGRKQTCRIPVDRPLANATSARLVLSTWSAAHDGEIGINDKKLVDRIGLVHNYSFDTIPVPVRSLKTGDNVVSLFSNTKHHAAEVNWPGPALLIEYRTPAARPERGPWRFTSATHRLFVDVDHAGAAPIEVSLQADGFEPVHVAEAATGAAAPFQFDRGELVFLPDASPPGPRRFEVYLSRSPAPAAASPFKVTDDVDWEGQKSFRIETPAATYLYQKEGAAFASLLDRDGKDWIGYHPQGGSAGNFRGLPNLGDNFAHPGHTGVKGSDSRIVSQGPVRVRILSERHDKTWAAIWDIYPKHARMTLLRNGAPFWFLYEGTPGGKLDQKDGYLVLSNGERLSLGDRWSGHIGGPRWVYFGGVNSPFMLFIAKHEADAGPDMYFPLNDDMTVFGFGRQFTCCGQFLNTAPARFSVGLIPASDMDNARKRIESAMREPVIRQTHVEVR